MDVRSDGWYSLVAMNLARIARCKVVCSMYESRAGDRTLGPHTDSWFGIIVQFRGAKDWKVWHDSVAENILLSTGDMMLLPEGLEHDVSTPEYSVHLVFALVTSEPL